MPFISFIPSPTQPLMWCFVSMVATVVSVRILLKGSAKPTLQDKSVNRELYAAIWLYLWY